MTDITVDLTICKLEGWSMSEYVEELHNLIEEIYQKIIK